jgi:hypothetical protein
MAQQKLRTPNEHNPIFYHRAHREHRGKTAAAVFRWVVLMFFNTAHRKTALRFFLCALCGLCGKKIFNTRAMFVFDIRGRSFLGGSKRVAIQKFFRILCTEIKVSSTVKETSHYKALSLEIPLSREAFVSVKSRQVDF